MNRIVTNIVNINELTEKLPDHWLTLLENDKYLDMHEVFLKYGEHYNWLYENSNIDLIA